MSGARSMRRAVRLRVTRRPSWPSPSRPLGLLAGGSARLESVTPPIGVQLSGRYRPLATGSAGSPANAVIAPGPVLASGTGGGCGQALKGLLGRHCQGAPQRKDGNNERLKLHFGRPQIRPWGKQRTQRLTSWGRVEGGGWRGEAKTRRRRGEGEGDIAAQKPRGEVEVSPREGPEGEASRGRRGGFNEGADRPSPPSPQASPRRSSVARGRASLCHRRRCHRLWRCTHTDGGSDHGREKQV